MRAKVRVFPKNDENFRANYIFLHIRTKNWDSLRMEKSGCKKIGLQKWQTRFFDG